MSSEPSSWNGEIERHSAHLSSIEAEESPYTISGIAIGEGDITRGQSGVKKKWPKEALKPAAETLEDRPLVVDHQNTSYATVGEITHVEYKDGVGVLYEAELYDEELAKKVENGLLEVSIRGFHGDVENMDYDPDSGAKVVQKMAFDNLSIVPTGAAPSNTASIGELDVDDVDTQAEAAEAPGVLSGPSTDLSAAECAELLGSKVEGDTEENADRPEGAEEPVEPNEPVDQPERAPEGETSEEAGEHTGDEQEEEAEDSPATEDDEIAPHDEAEEELESQSRGAGSSGEPEPNTANLTFVPPTMSEEITEELEDYSDPTIVEGDELSELRKAASKVEELSETVEELREDEAQDETSATEELKEQFEDDLAELKERTAVLDGVDRSQVEDLSEADSPLVVEEDEYEELQDDVDTFHGVMAEMLADEVALGAETIEEKFSTAELKEELEERREENLEEQVEEELSPDPKTEDVDEEELEEAAEEQHEAPESEELEEEVEDAQARLREKMGISE